MPDRSLAQSSPLRFRHDGNLSLIPFAASNLFEDVRLLVTSDGHRIAALDSPNAITEMTPKNLQDLYLHQLRDMYSAESHIVNALPRMARKASNPQLQQAFETHLDQTKQHKTRLEKIFERMDESPTGQTCKATVGLIEEAEDLISDAKKLFGSDSPPEVLDAGLISQAQRLEHYEISAYGTLATYAEMLGRLDDHKLLSATLQEEKATDSRLNVLAKEMVNIEAMSAS